MKMRIALGIVVSLVAFALGVVGMYFSMPYVAPDRVEATHHYLDSLAAVETEFRAPVNDSTAWAGDSTALAADSTGLIGDSLLAAGGAVVPLQSEVAAFKDSLTAFKDSLAVLQSLLAQRDTERAKLRDRVQGLQQAMKQVEAREEQTVELANTLAKLEDRELEEILSKLNTDVLERLYFEATGRNRTRLLQTMPAARAASFVGRLVGDEAAPASSPATVSSTDANASGPDGTN